MQKVNISLNGKKKSILPGLVSARKIYEALAVSPENETLVLNRKNDVAIPLFEQDNIFMRGNEAFSSVPSTSDYGDGNPALKQPVKITINQCKIDKGLSNAKANVSQLIELDTGNADSSVTFRLYLRIDEHVDVSIENDQTIVVQEEDIFIIAPVGEDGIVDVELCSKLERIVPKGQASYRIKIDGEKYVVNKEKLTGEEIISLARKAFGEWSLNQKLRGGRRVPIEAEQSVDIAKPGIERFETVRRQAQQGFSCCR